MACQLFECNIRCWSTNPHCCWRGTEAGIPSYRSFLSFCKSLLHLLDHCNVASWRPPEKNCESLSIFVSCQQNPKWEIAKTLSTKQSSVFWFYCLFHKSLCLFDLCWIQRWRQSETQRMSRQGMVIGKMRLRDNMLVYWCQLMLCMVPGYGIALAKVTVSKEMPLGLRQISSSEIFCHKSTCLFFSEIVPLQIFFSPTGLGRLLLCVQVRTVCFFPP